MIGVVIIAILLMLPRVWPVSWADFNYPVVAVAVALGSAGIYWRVSARNWFTLPNVQGTAEEPAAIERELTEI